MSLQTRLDALISAIGADIKALYTKGLGGENLLPELMSIPWATGGSGVVATWLQSTPVQFIGENLNQRRYTVKLVSSAATGSIVMLQLNPAVRYLWLRPNKTYTWAIKVRSEDFSRDFRLRSLFFREDGAVQIATPGGEYSALKASVVDDWVTLTRTFTTPTPNAGEEWVRFKPFLYCNNLADTDIHYATEPVMVEGDVVPNYSPRPGDFLTGVDTPSAAGASNSRSVIINRSHAIIDAGPTRLDIATNYDPTTNRLIDTTRGSYMLRFFIGGPRMALAWAPATAGAPVYVEILTVNSAGDLAARSLKPSTFTTATKPTAASVGAGGIIFVSDGAAGAKFQGSDGTNWLNLG